MNNEYREAIKVWQEETGKRVRYKAVKAKFDVLGLNPIKAIEKGDYEQAIVDMQNIIKCSTSAEGARKAIAYVVCLSYDLYIRKMVQQPNHSRRWDEIKMFEEELLRHRGFELKNINDEAFRQAVTE